MRRNPHNIEKDHAQPRRDQLQRRDQFLPHRHHEEGVEEREQQRPRHGRAEQGDNATLQHQDDRGVAEHRDTRRRSQQPGECAQRHPDQSGCPCDRLKLAQAGKSLLHKPGDQERDEEAVAKSGRVPPYRHHARRIAMEQREDQERQNAKRGEMPAPAFHANVARSRQRQRPVSHAARLPKAGTGPNSISGKPLSVSDQR